jgi:hypothetical protein
MCVILIHAKVASLSMTRKVSVKGRTTITYVWGGRDGVNGAYCDSDWEARVMMMTSYVSTCNTETIPTLSAHHQSRLQWALKKWLSTYVACIGTKELQSQ